MPQDVPDGAFIEIVEKTRKVNHPEVLVPNEVRINGTRLLTPDDGGIRVHEIDLGRQDELVKVTLTLFARRVEIKSEVSE